MKIKHDGIVWVTLLVIAIGVLVGYWALVAKYTSYFSGQVALATEPNEANVGIDFSEWMTSPVGEVLLCDFNDTVTDPFTFTIENISKQFTHEEFRRRLGFVESKEDCITKFCDGYVEEIEVLSPNDPRCLITVREFIMELVTFEPNELPLR